MSQYWVEVACLLRAERRANCSDLLEHNSSGSVKRSGIGLLSALCWDDSLVVVVHNGSGGFVDLHRQDHGLEQRKDSWEEEGTKQQRAGTAAVGTRTDTDIDSGDVVGAEHVVILEHGRGLGHSRP